MTWKKQKDVPIEVYMQTAMDRIIRIMSAASIALELGGSSSVAARTWCSGSREYSKTVAQRGRPNRGGEPISEDLLDLKGIGNETDQLLLARSARKECQRRICL